MVGVSGKKIAPFPGEPSLDCGAYNLQLTVIKKVVPSWLKCEPS